MRVERVCVKRLKTFEYYGNAAVELCALVDENDRLDDVVSWLQVKVEAYVERQKEVAKLDEYKQAVEQLTRDVRELLERLEEQRRELSKRWGELSRLIGELRDVEDDVAKAKTVIERIKEKLKG